MRLTLQLLFQHGGRNSDGGEILTDFVVEIPSDALSLPFADGDDLLFELLRPFQELELGAHIIPLFLERPSREHY